jgi:t-SNARE complex subunit (syntaxin)
MKITVQNIEAYLLDYCTNQLSQKDRVAVDKFILENPEWMVRAEELIHLPVEHVVFPNKDRLKKEIEENEAVRFDDDQNTREYLLFLISEGQLEVKQKKTIDEWCKIDSAFKKEVDWALQTRLRPDEDTRYPNKTRLKRVDKSKRMIYWVSATAASIALFISLITGQQSTSKPLLRAQNKSHQTSDSLVNSHAEITSQSKRQEQGVNATLSVPVLKNISKNAINQYSQKELKTEDSLVNQEIIQNQLPDQFVEYIAIDTLLKSNEIDTQRRQYDTLNPKPKATKTELVQPDEYTAGFRPKGNENNWRTVSRKLANISKNNLIVRATSTWDFSVKIGKFSFSRNKYSSKSNLSMK